MSLGGGWCSSLLNVGMKGSGCIGQCSLNGLLLAAARRKRYLCGRPTAVSKVGLHDRLGKLDVVEFRVGLGFRVVSGCLKNTLGYYPQTMENHMEKESGK